ncbi:MAG: hypothetical protein AAFP69_23895, partial [Planctomycetota bacterium]
MRPGEDWEWRDWNLQLQYAGYQNDLNNGAQQLVVGAYAFHDTIPASSAVYNANLAKKLESPQCRFVDSLLFN